MWSVRARSDAGIATRTALAVLTLQATPALLPRPDVLERLPVEVDAVAGPVRRHGHPRHDPERLGYEPIEPEAVGLEVRAVRNGGQQVHGDVMGAVRGHGQVEGLGQVADLHECRDAAAVR